MANVPLSAYRNMATALLLLLGINSITHASEPEGNHFVIVPYLWGVNVDAQISQDALSIPVDVDTRELIDGLEIGAMGYLQWSFDQNFLYLEGLGGRFKDEQFEPFFDQQVEADIRFVRFGYGRDIVLRQDSERHKQIVVSPFIGLIHADLDATVKGLGVIEIEETWTGPTVGFMASGPIAGPFSSVARLETALPSNAVDEYLDGLIAVRYHYSDKIAIGLGYRYLHGHYADGGPIFDVTLDGLIMGVQFDW